jgi:hypothetical protein
MKRIFVSVLIILLYSSFSFAGFDPRVRPSSFSEADLSGLSTTPMTGYPEGAQPLSDNLNYLTVGDDPFLTLANRQLTAPTPIKGHKYVASPWWDPATRCLTLTSNTTYTAPHTITVTEAVLTFVVNEVMKTDDATNTGPFTITAATNNGTTTTLTVSETVTGVAADTKTVIHGFLYWVGFTGTVYFTWMDDQGNLILSDINLAGGTLELPQGTATAPVTEGGIYHNTSTDANTIGDSATAHTLATFISGGTTSAADSLAIPVTAAYVAKTTGADAEALTLANGKPGQILNISLAVDGGGDGTLTPTTKSGFATIVFADVGDNASLMYVNDTVGWILLGTAGVAAPPVITQ